MSAIAWIISEFSKIFILLELFSKLKSLLVLGLSFYWEILSKSRLDFLWFCKLLDILIDSGIYKV